MVPEASNIKRMSLTALILMMVLGIITLALSPLTGHYRGYYLCLTLGLVITITQLIYLPIIYLKRTNNARDIGRPAMQALWIGTSMGIGYLISAPAPYFLIPLPILLALIVIGMILIIYGIYNLLKISRLTGLPLAI